MSGVRNGLSNGIILEIRVMNGTGISITRFGGWVESRSRCSSRSAPFGPFSSTIGADADSVDRQDKFDQRIKLTSPVGARLWRQHGLDRFADHREDGKARQRE